jgi:hypothetical protein
MKTISLFGSLVVSVLATHLFAQQNPNGQLPIGTTDQPYLFLVRDPVVHRDLKLDERQLRAVRALNDETDAAMWSMRNKPHEIVATMKMTTQTTQRRLAEILTPQQVKRISQIELRVLGVRSLVREDVARELKLSTDARSEIQRILTSTQAEMAKLQQQLQEGGPADELNDKHRALKTDEQTQVFSLLDDDQKRKLFAILGEQIDLSQLGRIKFKAPDLQGTTWVNSEPLTMEKLKGKVVALHFYAFA